jgi:hypothetical protein
MEDSYYVFSFFSLDRKETKDQEPSISTHLLHGIAMVQASRAATEYNLELSSTFLFEFVGALCGCHFERSRESDTAFTFSLSFLLIEKKQKIKNHRFPPTCCTASRWFKPHARLRNYNLEFKFNIIFGFLDTTVSAVISGGVEKVRKLEYVIQAIDM